MDDDPYAEGYSDGQADARALYDPASWTGNPPWGIPTHERVPIYIHPEALNRLENAIENDSRFGGITNSQFIMMALDLLTQ